MSARHVHVPRAHNHETKAMTAKDFSGTKSKRELLEGTRPVESSDKDSKQEKDKPESTAGEAPIDPADEAFIGPGKKD